MNTSQQSIVSEILSDISMTSTEVEALPWVHDFLDALNTLNRRIGLRWCEAVAKIGVDLHEVQTQYCPVFLDKVQERLEELEADMEMVTAKFLDRIQERLQSIEHNCRLLQVEMPCYNNEGKTIYELYEYLTKEKEHFQTIVTERQTLLQRLEHEQTALCRLLERPRKHIQHDPLPKQSDLDNLETYIKQLSTLKSERLERFHQMKYDICELVAELQQAPSLDFERKVVESEVVCITDRDMANLESYLKRLKADYERVKEEICELQLKIDSLWNTLDVSLTERSEFTKKNITGNNYGTLEALKLELGRCEKLKRDNIRLFVDKLREQLTAVWQQCQLDVAEQKAAFFAFGNDLYNEDLLELHERELKKWQEYYVENERLFELLKKHGELWTKFEKLQRTSDAATRYKNRGGKLLAEERVRNMCNKKIPELEEQLRNAAQEYENAKGKCFRAQGKSVDEYLEAIHTDFDEATKQRLSAKKQQRDKTTPMSCTTSSRRPLLFATPASTTTSNLGGVALTTPRGLRQKRPLTAITTPSTDCNGTRFTKKKRISGSNTTTNKNKKQMLPKMTAASAGPTFKVTEARRSFKRKRLSFKKANNSRNGKENKEYGAENGAERPLAEASYNEFAEDLVSRHEGRSTEYRVV